MQCLADGGEYHTPAPEHGEYSPTTVRLAKPAPTDGAAGSGGGEATG